MLAQYEALHAEREAVGGVRPHALPAAYPTAALLGCVETPPPPHPFPGSLPSCRLTPAAAQVRRHRRLRR